MNTLLGLLTLILSLNCCYASCNPVCEWAGVASVLSGWAGSGGAEEIQGQGDRWIEQAGSLFQIKEFMITQLNFLGM